MSMKPYFMSWQGYYMDFGPCFKCNTPSDYLIFIFFCWGCYLCFYGFSLHVAWKSYSTENTSFHIGYRDIVSMYMALWHHCGGTVQCSLLLFILNAACTGDIFCKSFDLCHLFLPGFHCLHFVQWVFLQLKKFIYYEFAGIIINKIIVSSYNKNFEKIVINFLARILIKTINILINFLIKVLIKVLIKISIKFADKYFTKFFDKYLTKIKKIYYFIFMIEYLDVVYIASVIDMLCAKIVIRKGYQEQVSNIILSYLSIDMFLKYKFTASHLRLNYDKICLPNSYSVNENESLGKIIPILFKKNFISKIIPVLFKKIFISKSILHILLVKIIVVKEFIYSKYMLYIYMYVIYLEYISYPICVFKHMLENYFLILSVAIKNCIMHSTCCISAGLEFWFQYVCFKNNLYGYNINRFKQYALLLIYLKGMCIPKYILKLWLNPILSFENFCHLKTFVQ